MNLWPFKVFPSYFDRCPKCHSCMVEAKEPLKPYCFNAMCEDGKKNTDKVLEKREARAA